MYKACWLRDLFLHLVNDAHFDIIALNETHLISMPSTWCDVVRASGYKLLFSAAKKTNAAGRASGGTIVLVK
jgi:hypothetical protein